MVLTAPFAPTRGCPHGWQAQMLASSRRTSGPSCRPADSEKPHTGNHTMLMSTVEPMVSMNLMKRARTDPKRGWAQDPHHATFFPQLVSTDAFSVGSLRSAGPKVTDANTVGTDGQGERRKCPKKRRYRRYSVSTDEGASVPTLKRRNRRF